MQDVLDALRNVQLSSGAHQHHGVPGDARQDLTLLGWMCKKTPAQQPPADLTPAQQPPADLVGRRVAIHLTEPLVLADPTSTETLLPGLCYGRCEGGLFVIK